MKKKEEKNIIKRVLFFGALLLLFAGVIVFSGKEEDLTAGPSYVQKESIVVGACPTFHYLIYDLQEEGYSTVRLGSPAEGFQRTEEGEVDLFLSSRGVGQGEPDFPSLNLEPGYVFLFREEAVLLEKEMGTVNFYTDQPAEEVLESFPYIPKENLKKVGDVENYLQEGVVITSIENEKKGEPVHVREETGRRLRLTVVPRLFYSPEVSEKEALAIKEILDGK